MTLSKLRKAGAMTLKLLEADVKGERPHLLSNSQFFPPTTTASKKQKMTNAPSNFICPITSKVMVQPLMSKWGQSYEKHAVIRLLDDKL